MLTEVNNSEFTVNNHNLKSWKPGVSGNPKGRPTGSRNIKKVIQDLLNDPGAAASLSLDLPRGTETPLEAIVQSLIIKAMSGDVRASDVLLKHSIDKDFEPIEGGFFSSPTELIINVVQPDGSLKDFNDPNRHRDYLEADANNLQG